MKTFETHERMIAGELARKGYKSTRRAAEGLATMFVFEVEDDFVAPKQSHLRRQFRHKRLHTARPKSPVTRQILVAKGLVKPAEPVVVPTPAPKIAPPVEPTFEAMLEEVIKSEPVSVPAPVVAKIAPKPPKVWKIKLKPLPAPTSAPTPGATFSPFANLRDLLVSNDNEAAGKESK